MKTRGKADIPISTRRVLFKKVRACLRGGVFNEENAVQIARECGLQSEYGQFLADAVLTLRWRKGSSESTYGEAFEKRLRKLIVHPAHN